MFVKNARFNVTRNAYSIHAVHILVIHKFNFKIKFNLAGAGDRHGEPRLRLRPRAPPRVPARGRALPRLTVG